MITALIPARGGSVRIPDKNIVDLAGSPLVTWTITAALASVAIDRVVVSSDEPRILALAEAFPGVFAIKRSAEASNDGANDWAVVSEYLETSDDDAEFIVYLRPTTPLRRVAWIDYAISTFRNIKSASGLRSIHPMSEPAGKCFYLEAGSILETLDERREVDLANEPSHLYRATYHPNGAVDIIRPRLVKDGALYGDNCYGYLTPWTVEIDTPTDLAYARFLAERKSYDTPISIKVD